MNRGFSGPLVAAAVLAAPACAQPGPTVEAEATLADGRVVEAVTFGDGSYQLRVEGLFIPGMADGAPESLHVGDIDGDGAEDVVALLRRRTPDGPQGAHAWDVTLDQPYALFATDDVPLPDRPVESLAAHVALRFSIPRALEELEALRSLVDAPEIADGERVHTIPAVFDRLEWALRNADVVRARAALATGAGSSLGDPELELRLAMEARQNYALGRDDPAFGSLANPRR